ncbi:MAG: YraN family protein [Candidatus Brocadiia bacterium]
MAPGKSGRVRGEQGERLAEEFLRKLGCKVLRRNWHSRLGEIDLIVRDGDEVVFVEVKLRASGDWGAPQEAVTSGKRRSICLAASEFADRNRLHGHTLRFDVVAVLLPPGGAPEIRHYKDAFPIVRPAS